MFSQAPLASYLLATLLGASALFEPPVAGSYELPEIGRVSEHVLLDSTGKPGPMLGLEPGQVAVLGFVYRSCTDADGCPLSLAVLRKLDRELAARDDRRVRLVTVSFDPERDTPGKMKMLREHMQPRSDWRFLTAPGEAAIAPVLADFGQDVMRGLTRQGADTGLIRHVLKVFLVDATGAVRNVYSSGFLDARILANDVETVLAASAK